MRTLKVLESCKPPSEIRIARWPCNITGCDCLVSLSKGNHFNEGDTMTTGIADDVILGVADVTDEIADKFLALNWVEIV